MLGRKQKRAKILRIRKIQSTAREIRKKHLVMFETGIVC